VCYLFHPCFPLNWNLQSLITTTCTARFNSAKSAFVWHSTYYFPTHHSFIFSNINTRCSLRGRNWICIGYEFIMGFRKIAKVDYLLRLACQSICLSVHPHGTIRLPLDRFLLNLKFQNFRTYVEKIQGSLKTDKNKGHFTWRPIYIFDHISLTSSQHEKCFRQNLYRKSQHTFDVQWRFSENLAVYEIMWKSIVEPDRQQLKIWRMRISCWIPKAADTHSQYVIIIAFPRQQCLHEHASILRYTYIACLVLVFKWSL
jgi:hypothetical protein